MPKFLYVARDKTGNKVNGAEEASNQEEIVRRLQSRNLVIVNIVPESMGGVSGFGPGGIAVKTYRRPKHYRVTANDLVLFCRQLTILLGAGITILKSLDIISKQVSSRKLYNIIKDLQKNMEAGLSFHEAMAKHPSIFSELWVNLVESGEASGNLAAVLSRLATYLERDAAFRSKIISSLIYPLILLVVALGALLFLTIKIIPAFAQLFAGFNIDLPFLTKVLVGLSNFIRKFMILIVGVIIMVFYLVRRYVHTKGGRKNYENFKFGLPIFGEFFRALIVERFSSEMATLVESGVPILYSLEIVEHSVDNLVIAEVIRKIKEEVREGRPLKQPLEKSGFFEPMVVQMVAIGEEIGELSQMFKRINGFYQEYAEMFLARFSAMFEPIVLVFLGLVIGTMVVGMFLPIFQIARIGGGL